MYKEKLTPLEAISRVSHLMVPSPFLHTTTKNVCSNSIIFFVGAAGDGAAPIVGVLGTHKTSRPYKWHGRDGWWYNPPLQMSQFVGVAHSSAAPGVAICRGGSITSRLYKCPTYKNLQPLLSPRVTHSNPWKKGREALGTSQKLLY